MADLVRPSNESAALAVAWQGKGDMGSSLWMMLPTDRIGKWTRLALASKAPAGAISARIMLEVGSGPREGEARYDKVQMALVE